MDLVSELQRFDLTRNESAVYVELLKCGQVPASDLIKRTRLHRQLVYQSLASLEQKHLASSTMKDGKNLFCAADPREILYAISERERAAKSLIPKLLNLRVTVDDQVEAKVSSGSKEFFTNLQLVFESAARGDRVVRIIGGADANLFFTSLGPLAQAYVDLGKELKIKKHLLIPIEYPKENKVEVLKQHRGNQIRELRGLSAATFTRITHELVTFEVYGREIKIIRIENKAVASACIEQFELLWANAREFEL